MHDLKLTSPLAPKIHDFMLMSWKSRANFDKTQREGFAQMFYIILCAHIEEILCCVVKGRLNSIRLLDFSSLKPLAIYSFKQTLKATEFTQIDLNNPEADLTVYNPGLDSLLRIVEAKIARLDGCSIKDLEKQYNELFPQCLDSVLGNELKFDYQALIDLRNHFSHGRVLEVVFTGPLNQLKLEHHPFKTCIDRLHHAKLFSSISTLRGNNHDEFQQAVFSDKALQYFCNIAKKIKCAILSANPTDTPEVFLVGVSELPDFD